jgi:Ca-activated chloride channel family protein
MDYVRGADVQKKFTDAGFRTWDGRPGSAINGSQYVRADGPKILLGAPSPTVLADVRNAWSDLRKPARVLFLVDESGSMTENVPGTASTRIELAKLSLERALRQFQPRDSVGVWGFTTYSDTRITREVTPVEPVDADQARLQNAARSLDASQGTPLYAAIRRAVAAMKSGYDPSRINAIVVLTDGQNEYPDDNDKDGLIAQLGNPEQSGGVRVFSVAYGSDSDLATLKAISEASQAAAYDATNAASIDQVMTAVVSNF